MAVPVGAGVHAVRYEHDAVADREDRGEIAHPILHRFDIEVEGTHDYFVTA